MVEGHYQKEEVELNLVGKSETDWTSQMVETEMKPWGMEGNG